MRFIEGDELGNIKLLRPNSGPEPKSELQNLRTGTAQNASVQVLSAARTDSVTLVLCFLSTVPLAKSPNRFGRQLAAGYSNGSAELFSLAEDDSIESLQQWTETRLKAGQKYVGLHCNDKYVFAFSSDVYDSNHLEEISFLAPQMAH